MLCPEGELVSSNVSGDRKETFPRTKVPTEGSGSFELSSYKSLKTWKKSLRYFFRHSLRSTKSNEGDHPTESKDSFETKGVAPEQKWQSLGKVFRRQSFAEYWNKTPSQQGESTSQSTSKRHGVRKVLSNYFGKSQKSSQADQ